MTPGDMLNLNWRVLESSARIDNEVLTQASEQKPAKADK